MYSFPYLEQVCCFMSSSNCCFLTCIQISQEAGNVVWYLLWSTQSNSLIIDNKAEVDVFRELSCFFDDPTELAIWSLVPLPFLKPAWIRKFMVHVLLKPGLENFEHYFTSMWDECNCAVVWAFYGIAFLWDWNENWPFPVLWPLLSFPCLLAYWVKHFHSIIFQDLK